MRRSFRRCVSKATPIPHRKAWRREFVLDFQRVAVEAPNALHERATPINAGGVRPGPFWCWSVFGQKLGQFLRLLDREPEIRHANPRVMRFGFAQELDEFFRWEFPADVLQ